MSRWKAKNAQKIASDNPLSALHNAIRGMEPADCVIVDSGGIVTLNAAQFKLLTNAGIGSLLAVEDNRKLTFPGSGEAAEESCDAHTLQLTLEEAFFLAFELQCLRFYRKSSEGRFDLSVEEAWRSMQDLKPNFAKLYKGYSHLRTKRWVVRPGPQYGADFMAYRHHPSLVHSDYAVLVLDEQQQTGMQTWSAVRGMCRLCSSVAKVLLLLYVGDSIGGIRHPRLRLDGMSVREVEVKRWVPEKHRAD